MSEKSEKPTPKPIRFNRVLPYLAVLQADLHQTLLSWVYRVWVLLSVVVAVGYFLYRVGAYREAGMIQTTGEVMSDLVRWVVLGSVTLIIVLTAGCISSERGTLADSVLSRGVSRHQYFLAKWHSRLLSVLGTFFLIGSLVLLGSFYVLRDGKLTLAGSVLALAQVGALLIVVVTASVTVSAIVNSTLLGVAMVWMLLYGVGFGLSFLPETFPSPDRTLGGLSEVLKGTQDWKMITEFFVWTTGVSLLLAVGGLSYFSQRDV
ncbi:MAG: ABC transporter permease [Gemmataceae bacterium]